MSATRRSALTPAYTYSDTAGRYRDARGRFVTNEAVRAALDATLDNASKTVVTMTQQLRAGEMTLPDWQRQMAEQVKRVHLASAALGKGGWAQLTQADLGRVGAVVKEQLGYLRERARLIGTGAQRLDGTLVNRARLYVQAGRTTYHDVRRRVVRVLGHTEERRVLHAKESCSDCVGFARQGWVALGTLPLPGQESVCRMNCRCTLETRKAA